MHENEKTNSNGEKSQAIEGMGGAWETPPPFSLTASKPVQKAESETGEDGPGEWVTTQEAMSGAASAYQSFITGRPATDSYVVGGVKFDGFSSGNLLEAKSNMENFVHPETGDFQPWFKGADEMVAQGRRQERVSSGYPINWHIQKKPVAAAIGATFESRGLSKINVIHSPN